MVLMEVEEVTVKSREIDAEPGFLLQSFAWTGQKFDFTLYSSNSSLTRVFTTYYSLY